VELSGEVLFFGKKERKKERKEGRKEGRKEKCAWIE
jgi:hypothetical protein